MKNERPIKELLQIMLYNLEELSSGLCALARQLYGCGFLTHEEKVIIYDYIENNIFETDDLGYCWTLGEIEPRREWLKQQIELLS